MKIACKSFYDLSKVSMDKKEDLTEKVKIFGYRKWSFCPHEIPIFLKNPIYKQLPVPKKINCDPFNETFFVFPGTLWTTTTNQIEKCRKKSSRPNNCCLITLNYSTGVLITYFPEAKKKVRKTA